MISLEIFFITSSLFIYYQAGTVAHHFIYKIRGEQEGFRNLEIVSGCSIVLIYSSILYQFGLATNIIFYSLVISLVAARSLPNIRKPATDNPYFYGITLLVIYSILGTESYKVFQGFAYDRFAYLSAALMYKEFTYHELTRMTSEIFAFGNTSPLYIQPLSNRIPGSVYNRPIIEFLFSTLTTPYGGKSYLLANSFESLARILLYSISYATFSLFSKNKYLVLLASICYTMGYSGQVVKDYNAWSMQLALPLSLLFIYMIRKQGELGHYFNFVKLSIVNGAALAVYPEGLCYLGLAYAISALFVFSNSPQRLKAYLALLSASLLIYTILNFDRLDYILRQYAISNQMEAVDAVKNLFQYLPNTGNTFLERAAVFGDLLNNPFSIRLNFIFLLNFIPAFFGLYILNDLGYFWQSLFSIMVIYLCVHSWLSRRNQFEIVVILISILMPFFFYFKGNYYGFGRAVSYSSFVASFCLILVFLENLKNSTIAKILLLTFICTSCLFIYFNVKNVYSYEKIDFDYSFSYDRLANTDRITNVKSSVDFETTSIQPYLGYCRSYNLDVDQTANTWLFTYALIMIGNGGPGASLADNRLTGIFSGDKMLNVDKGAFNGDCLITTFERNGKLHLDLVFLNFHPELSIMRGPL